MSYPWNYLRIITIKRRERMIKLNITLGNTIFSHLFLPYSDEYGPIIHKIYQHRVVISKKILDYYEDCAEKIGLKDAYLTYIQSLIQSQDRCLIVEGRGKDNIKEELIETAFLQQMKILIAEKDEIRKAKKGVNLLSCEDINGKPECVFNLYRFPIINRYVAAKKPVGAYVKWLSNWIKGEKKLIIRDRYLLTPHGIASFKKYYLPMIEKGATIKIQTDEDVDKCFLDEFDKSLYDDYQFSIYKCSKMHERVIILEKFQIVIGAGIDFLSADWELTKESFVSISEITIETEKTEIQQLR